MYFPTLFITIFSHDVSMALNQQNTTFLLCLSKKHKNWIMILDLLLKSCTKMFISPKERLSYFRHSNVAHFKKRERISTYLN